ncbi:MAG TPA: uracil-DNA glycosylase, partial [Candidatus Hydrogenedentes bacterium]|nr:uracil-DNA glycosylase [Candidatus Hydrogenedentota bacterium]
MNNGNWLKQIIEETRQLIEQAASGAQRTIVLSPEVVAMLENVRPQAAPSPPFSRETVSEEPADYETGSDLAELEREVAQCTKCGLAKCRTQTVFGDGSPEAKLVFVGEAPGAEEDRQGRPFVGRAGQLLTDIIEKGMKLRRRDVYICNVLKCRPPGNRNPSPEEVYYCEPYLIRQLEIIQPKVICALGKYAAQTLLKNTAPVSRLRGRWWEYHGIPLRV